MHPNCTQYKSARQAARRKGAETEGGRGRQVRAAKGQRCCDEVCSGQRGRSDVLMLVNVMPVHLTEHSAEHAHTHARTEAARVSSLL